MTAQHVFKTILPVHSRRELAEHLYKNILFNEEGVVALNKPYGLRNGLVFEDPCDSKFKNVNVGDYSLSEVLPLLCEMLNVPSLKVCRTPEKFASGVTLLNVDNDAGIRLSRSVSHALCQKRFTYQALCYGVPQKPSADEKMGLEFKKTDENKHAVTLLNKFSRQSILQGTVKKIFYSHNLISTDLERKVSLVEVITNRIMWYYVPLYLSTQLLTPVIGDHIHGSKVKYVFDKPILLPILNPVGYLPQKFPKDFYQQLSILEKDYMLIPNHLHLSEITLHHWGKKHNHLKISAPLPPYFQWTCSQLKMWNDPVSSLPIEVSI